MTGWGMVYTFGKTTMIEHWNGLQKGGPAFVGAGLFEKSHIQICIRNPNCIQGFFMPRAEIDFTDWLEKSLTN
jgi:hypothetical protein